ncbi:hypothetical protein FHG87_025652, partial [Trinorchestia longiramus]
VAKPPASIPCSIVSYIPSSPPPCRVLYLNITGIAALLSLLNVCGLAIFTVYAGCDPITLGLVSKKDQMLPYFVIGYLGFLKGVPGLFVACLISGTMRCLLFA